MKKDTKTSAQAAEVRRRAEERLREKQRRQRSKVGDQATAGETQRLVHELQVHQIELEMQNEELRRTQVELEASRARYFDLYDLAPVGYCTLNEKGLIHEGNLTAAAMLGVARNALVNQPLSRFILYEDQDIYYTFRKQLFEIGTPKTCELRMLRAGADMPRHVERHQRAQADRECPIVPVAVRVLEWGFLHSAGMLSGRVPVHGLCLH